MKVPVKYVVLVFAFIGGIIAFRKGSLAPAIVAAGAFIGYALIEIQDLRIMNQEEKEE